MTHQICDACECVSHCRKNGCVPLTPMDQAPVVTSSTDPKYLREALDKTFELLVRERGITKGLHGVVDATRDFLQAQDDLDNRELQGINGKDWSVLRNRLSFARTALDDALSKVPQ